MAKNKIIQKIYKEIQEEMGGDLQEIEQICESQFEYLEKIMKRGAFDSVRLSYFGRFHVNPNRLKKLNDAAFQRRQFSSSNKSGS